MEVELNCYKMLDHPHILRYHGHSSEKDEMLLRIYTEFCDLGDLGRYMKPSQRYFSPSSTFITWIRSTDFYHTVNGTG